MRSRTRQSAVNVIYGVASKIIVLLLEFVSRTYFIKYLGNELLGVSSVFTNIIQCLSLAELGINNVVMFSYYSPLATHDEIKLSALNSFYKKIYNSIAVIVAGVGIAVIPFLKYIINTENEIQNIALIYLLFLADTVVSYLCIYKITILTADQNIYISNRYDIAINIIRTVIQIISLCLFRNFMLYLCIKVAFGICGNLLKSKRVDKDYPFTKRFEPLQAKDKREIVSTIKSGVIYKLSSVLLNSTDNILISIIISTEMVGLLANYVTVCTAIASIVAIAFGGITASIGNLVTTESKEKKLEIFNVLCMASNWIAFVFFSCTLVLCNDFIGLWLGEDYILDFKIVLLKVMMLYISCSMQPIFSYREALGLYTKTKYVMMLSAVINIILSVLMGYFMGTSGILIASLIAVITTYYWYEPAILLKETFFGSVTKYFKNVIINILACGISSAGLFTIFSIFPCDSWLKWLEKGLLMFVITNLECTLLYFKTDEFKYLKNKFIKKKLS